jgi:HEAT repeat protein
VEAVPNLMEILPGGDVTLQLAGLHALEGIGRAAQPAIPAIIKALQAPEPVVRKTAAIVLGKFGPSAREAGTALQMAMQDSDAEVRQAAGDALLAIGTQMEPHPHNGQKISSRPPPAPTASPEVWRQAAVPVRGDTIIPANYVPAATPFPSAKPPVTLLAPIAGPSPTELAEAH